MYMKSQLSTHCKAVFTPQLWDRNRSGTQPGARVHTCSTASSRSGTSRPPRDVIAVERFRNGSGWLCGVNAQPDAFRSRLASTCVIMTDIQYILPKSVYPAKNPHTLVDRLLDFGTRFETFGTCMCPIRTQFGSFRFS